jgi:hypothetical protein
MAQLIILGGAFLMIGSLGNTIFLTRGIAAFVKVVLSAAIIFVATIYFFFDPEIDTWLVNTSWEDQRTVFSLFNYCALVSGCALIFMQFHTLARLLIPSGCVKTSKRLGRFLVSGAVPKEVRTKKAAAYKTNRMIENAMSLHLNGEELSTHKSLRASGFMSGNSHAMYGFLGKSYERERIGGLWWGWKEFLSGRICYEEGVFFHSRLIASCIAQLFLIFLISTVVILAFFVVNDLYRNAEAQGLDAEFLFGECYGTQCDLVGVAVNSTEGAVDVAVGTAENLALEELYNQTTYEEYFDYVIRNEINSTLTDILSGAGVVVDDALIDEFYVGFQASIYNVTGVDVVSAYSFYASLTSTDSTDSGLDWITESVDESE